MKKTTIIAALITALILSSSLQSMAQEQRRDSDLKKEIFLGEAMLSGQEDIAEGEAQFQYPKGERAARQNDIKLIMPRLAKDIESQLFKKNNKFWPTWNPSKFQILLVSQYYDFAYLLNNQNKDVDKIGTRIEYSARTINDVKIKVNPFGMTKINGIDTYYYNIDIMHQMGMSYEEIYEMHLSTLIHEAVHLLAQKDVKTADQIEIGTAQRGVSYPIDIKSRYFRNETHVNLTAALRAKNRKEKISFVRKALYFHQAYLNINSENEGHNEYDYAEGMAVYVHTAAIAQIKNPSFTEKQIQQVTGKNLMNIVEYSGYGNELGNKVLYWGKEYYTIGAMAFAMAVQLGHQDIYNSKTSPLTFLLKKYKILETAPSLSVKKDVYAYYMNMEKNIIDRKTEIDRVLNHKDNILIKLELSRHSEGSITILNDNILFNYKGQKASFEIREQEITFGDHRIKITEKGLVSLMPELPETGLSAGAVIIPDGDSTGGGIELIMGTLIIPVNKNDVTVSDGKISVQTNGLVLFDVKYERNGKIYTLVKE